ncbi:hypothetical protein AB1L42_04780 [Thalassoglobus sp. JC818]
MQYHLELEGEVVATIVSESYEFPWTLGRLLNSPEFEQFQTYFTDDNN